MLKNDGRERNSKIKEKKHSKKDKCSKCKNNYDKLEVKEESYKVNGVVMFDCNNCGNQILLK